MNFKVGDWVENITCTSPRIIKQVVNALEGYDTVIVGNVDVGINVMLMTDLELWRPKPSEWCWFYSKHTNIAPVLRKFEYKHNASFYTNDEMIFTGCEPFIGNLPSFIKDTHGTKQT